MGVLRPLLRQVRKLTVWHLACILTVVIYLGITFSGKKREKPRSPKQQLSAPKLNVQLSKRLENLKGSSYKDLGHLTTNFRTDSIKCVPFQTISSNTKICVYDTSRDEVVSKALVKHKTYDPNQLHDLEILLRNDKELALIDIGANLGTYTLTAAAMGRKVIALDACHGTVIRLQKSIQVNNFQNRVTLIEAALSSKPGYSFIFTPQGNQAGAYTHPMPREFITQLDIHNHRVVKNILIDDLVRFIDFDRAVVHIDVGGKEPLYLAKSSLFDIIYISSIFMTYTYNENYRKAFHVAIDEIHSKGFVPKTATMDFRSLDLGHYDKWPSRVLWVRK